MKKIIIILFLLVLLPGCGNKKEETIEMNCNNTVTKIVVKEKDKLTCKLLGDDYVFTIDAINDQEIKISANEYGLAHDGSLLSKDKSWIIEKGKELRLNTQTTDYQEIVVFNW